MKHVVNFRLSNRALAALNLLEKELHTSKTDVVEKALQLYIKKILANRNILTNFAGILNDKEAESMLDSIQTNKHNKDDDIIL